MKPVRILLFLLLILSINSQARADATVLFDIEIEHAGEETRVHLRADEPIKDYRIGQLKKNVEADRPERMYLDLKDVRLSGSIPVRKVGTTLARVRTGRRSDGIRVVFDSSLDELFSYTISEQPDGLLVTVREPFAAPPVITEIMAEVGSEVDPEPKVAGDLDLLIVTAVTPEHAQEWLDSPPGHRVALKIMKTAKTDQVINTSFLATEVTPDRTGDYSVTVSFTLLDPYGKLVLSKRRFATTSGRAPANPAFIMADPALSITLDESDPAGEYTIIGIVEDLTSNKMVRTSRKFTLEK